MLNPTIAYSVVDNVLLVCAGDDTPTDEEFGQMVKTIRDLHSSVTGILVLAGTKRPTSNQRSEMTAVLKRRALGLALVSESRLARGAITAIGWFVQGVKSFRESEIQQALLFLKADPSNTDWIISKLRELQASLALDQTA